MIKIYWHGKILKEFTLSEEGRAITAWNFFIKFLDKEHLVMKKYE